jgi:hypothetical protein
MNAFREYIRQCEVTFRILPDTYATDKAKVLYGIQFLRGETAKTFERLEQTNGPDNTSWEEYKTFLRDLLQDPVTRTVTQAHRWQAAMQRPGQTVAQFVNYLDELESELPAYTDEQRRQHLLGKLLPDIVCALNNYQAIPSTRKGLIALATQLEASLRKKKASQSQGRQEPATRATPRDDTSSKGKGKPRSQTQPQSKGTRGASTSPKSAASRPPRQRSYLSNEEKERRTKGKLCYTCGKSGHYAAQCHDKATTAPPEKKAENSQS